MSKSGGAAPECMMDDSVLVPHEVWKIEGFYTNLCIPGYQEWSQSCKRARALGWDIPSIIDYKHWESHYKICQLGNLLKLNQPVDPTVD